MIFNRHKKFFFVQIVARNDHRSILKGKISTIRHLSITCSTTLLHITHLGRKKLGQSSPSARVAIYTSYGVANFIPVVRILFFAIPGSKTPHSRFEAGRECGTFGQGVAKNMLLYYNLHSI